MGSDVGNGYNVSREKNVRVLSPLSELGVVRVLPKSLPKESARLCNAEKAITLLHFVLLRAHSLLLGINVFQEMSERARRQMGFDFHVPVCFRKCEKVTTFHLEL